jgi:hypothetical protein
MATSDFCLRNARTVNVVLTVFITIQEKMTCRQAMTEMWVRHTCAIASHVERGQSGQARNAIRETEQRHTHTQTSE